MQTRKRAKSAVFGKKAKTKNEKEVMEPVETVTSAVKSKKNVEKAAVVERRIVPEKPQIEESSTVLPKEEVTAPSEVTTPVSEFVTENPFSTTPVSSIPETEPPSIAQPEKHIEEPIAPSTPAVVPEQPVQPAVSQELSSTLPPSAFTIQTSEVPSVAVSEKKKSFWVYFLVVAFLSFILGLGAMAAVSYSGLLNIKVPKLSSAVHLPVFSGAKPTPTATPAPTAAPTQKPVNLQAYTISVLNGSGITGKAADVKASLVQAGFDVSSIGNADKSTYTRTELAAKKTVDAAYLSKLETALKKFFVVDTSVAVLPASSTTDVTITIGSQTAQ